MRQTLLLSLDPFLCLLCSARTELLEADAEGESKFARCTRCRLLQRDPSQHLTEADEAAFYQTHENDIGDPRYRAFLEKLVRPLQKKLQGGAVGLDFGCGPAPALVEMMKEAGFPTVGYDPLFANNTSLLHAQYDFVACTEVVEHFREPARSWQKLVSLLRPGGVLGVMTEWYRGQSPLSSWRYARDPTHVVFYSKHTFNYLAKEHALTFEFPGDNVVLFQRPD